MLSNVILGFILLVGIWLNNDLAYAQSLSLPTVKIGSPEINNQQVPIGEYVVSGTSSDNHNTDCTVYIDWNDLKPYQKVDATGLGGNDDYSNWTFTYTDSYHVISEGVNELTSKISCYSTPANLTKHYSLNVTGVESQREASPEELELENTQQEQNNDDTPIILPFASIADEDQVNAADDEEDTSGENNEARDGNNDREDSNNDEGDDFFDGDNFFDD